MPIIILAAGQGKRMHSELPKVLAPLAGQPMLHHIIGAVFGADPNAKIGIVVGHKKDDVIESVKKSFKSKIKQIDFITQKEQRGTGDAVRSAMQHEFGKRALKSAQALSVIPGDVPLITSELIRELNKPLAKGQCVRVISTMAPDPKGFGRIVRMGRQIKKIVEEKDATPKERGINEIALSMFTFEPKFLEKGLKTLSPKNAQGEYYLTDLIALAGGKKIDSHIWPTHQDVQGVNDLYELSLVEETLNQRLIQAWAKLGVRFILPHTITIDATVQLAKGVTVGAHVALLGDTKISDEVTIEQGAVLKNATIARGAHIKAGCVIEDSIIGTNAKVGPYAHLRPESWVGDDAKIGNFVELKKSKIGNQTSIAHLSYLGDAVVGERVNIGCGFITCNFDGRVIKGSRKHKSIIEDDVFMGSDCQIIAPIRIGKGAYVASGSTVQEDVPADGLAIARSRQVNKPGYAKKLRSRKS